MVYEIDYSDMLPLDKHRKAIADVKEYLASIGMEKEYYNKLIIESREHYTNDQFWLFRVHIGLVGIDGYPAKVLWDEIFPYS